MNTDKIYAQALANEYAPKDTSKVVALKKLDKRAKRPSDIFAYTFGSLMTLVAGVGMCLCLEQIGTSLPYARALGIAIGVAGFVGTALTYPIYKKIRERGKRKYAFEIIELAREISDRPE